MCGGGVTDDAPAHSLPLPRPSQDRMTTVGGPPRRPPRTEGETMSDDPKQRTPPPIHVRLDEATARGACVNLARVAQSTTEFMIDAMFLPPGSRQAQVVARLVLHPVHAKQLLGALGAEIQRHEAAFGEIPQPGNAPPDTILH